MLPNLLSHRPNIDEIYFHAKDTYDAKYKLLINKRKDVDLKNYDSSKAFIE